MLELSSNTIKVLGIFGRLSPQQEAYFDTLEANYSKKPVQQGYDIFRHLTLTFTPNASVSAVHEQLNLLRDLKPYLPVKLEAKKIFIKDEESMPGAEHIAIEFGLEQTKDLVEFIKNRVGDVAVATWYVKVVWFAPKENQPKVISELSEFKTLEFTNFYLVTNKQNDENTLFTASEFK